MTIGLVPGDYRFSDAWHSVQGWTMLGYFFALPAMLVTLTALLARRDQPCRDAGVLCLIALLVGAASWFVGLVGLAGTIWNE